MSTALQQAVAVVEALNPEDLEQLRRHLSIPSDSTTRSSHSVPPGEADKWSEFWRVGDELASQLGPGESPSKILNEMRR